MVSSLPSLLSLQEQSPPQTPLDRSQTSHRSRAHWTPRRPQRRPRRIPNHVSPWNGMPRSISTQAPVRLFYPSLHPQCPAPIMTACKIGPPMTEPVSFMTGPANSQGVHFSEAVGHLQCEPDLLVVGAVLFGQALTLFSNGLFGSIRGCGMVGGCIVSCDGCLCSLKWCSTF